MNKTFRIVSQAARHTAAGEVRGLDLDGTHEVCIRPHKKSRSLAQNRTLHMWCGEVALWAGQTHGHWHGQEHWKWYFKDMFLGYETVQVGKKTITQLKSTAGLKVKPFAEFLDKIDHFVGSEFLGCELTHSGEDYFAAMGIKR